MDATGKRVKEIRTFLNLNQELFGDRLGVTKTAISRIEKGERGLTDQMAKAISREYNVNYFWLTTGEGDMFVGVPETIIDELVEKYDLDELDRQIITNYINLTDEQRDAVKIFFDSFTGKKNGKQD